MLYRHNHSCNINSKWGIAEFLSSHQWELRLSRNALRWKETFYTRARIEIERAIKLALAKSCAILKSEILLKKRFRRCRLPFYIFSLTLGVDLIRHSTRGGWLHFRQFKETQNWTFLFAVETMNSLTTKEHYLLHAQAFLRFLNLFCS